MVQIMENRIRMQLLLFFCILGVNIYQAAGDDNSTQMMYFSLTIDSNAHNKTTALLTSFASHNWTVNNATETTSCVYSNTNIVNCSCSSGYRWSDKVCQSQKCCDNSLCVFPQTQPHMCVINTTVTITGSISLNTQNYTDCLAQPDQPNRAYEKCNENVTNKIQRIFSTVKGFDVLTIQKYRVGSVIADFQVIFFSNIDSGDLINKSTELVRNMSATMNLTTQGVVQMHITYPTALYLGNQTITCTSENDLGTTPTWQINMQNVNYTIYNGTEATVTSVPLITTVSLNRTTELWEGTYTCAYFIQTHLLNITHSATGVMDVALLPQITTYTDPQFPLCSSLDSLVSVKIYCKISQTSENYTVAWSSTDIIAAINNHSYEPTIPGYWADTSVGCDKPYRTVTCTFTNTQGQNRNTTIQINIIQPKDPHCAGDSIWPDTKAGYTAVLPCSNSAGQQTRTCLSTALWDVVISQCVQQDLYNVLQKSMIIDIGLGALDVNGALVLNQLKNATNNSQQISTFPNVNVSVEVLFNLNSKLNNITNTAAVSDFLTSSSNLLNISQNAWQSNIKDPNKTLTLAEQYMNSTEQLIKKSTLGNSTNQANIQVDICQTLKGCNNTVFGINVSLVVDFNSNSYIVVKTAGFQNLQNYLPNNSSLSNSSQPNSIVVTTTAQDNASYYSSPSSVAITIDFMLLSQRPRNVELICVAWDYNNSRWSENGCKWAGVANEGRCVCNHLSSFAILMSRKPIDLPYTTEITYAGLAVSIISLIISLMVEITVWGSVVKTNTLYLRHTAHFNISLCLLIADTCFLASNIGNIPDKWCQISAVLKHFCYLAMFFWMLCLSTTLLHQAVYLFHNVSKKGYLRFSLVLGYVCPFLIVFITFMTQSTGAKGSYYSSDGCWLVYESMLVGSIFTFLIPVGIIVFVNVFSMLVVIMKLLDHPKNTEKSHGKEKNAAKTVVRTVILLTPIFGITWSLGFAVMILDLTDGTIVFVVNYAFILLNSFQGFFILLTTCIMDKMVRETLLSRFRKKAPASIKDSTTKSESSWVK